MNSLPFLYGFSLFSNSTTTTTTTGANGIRGALATETVANGIRADNVSQQVGASQVLEQYLEASAKTAMDSLHAKLERFACEARARQIILP